MNLRIEEAPPIARCDPSYTPPYQAKHSYSIEPTFPSSRPTLEFPTPLPSLENRQKSFASIIARFIETLADIERNYTTCLSEKIDALQEAHLENLKKSQKENRNLEKEMAAAGFWDVLTKIALALIAALSLATGGSLLVGAVTAFETFAGGALITSGLSTLLGLALTESKVSPKLGAVLTMAGSGIGLLGGAGTALFATQDAMQLAGKIAVAVISISSHASEIVKEAYAIRIEEIRGAHAHTNSFFERNKEEMSIIERDLDALAQANLDNTLLVEAALKEYQNVNRRITLTQG